MAGQLRWVLVLLLSDTVLSNPGLVMVREEGVVADREKREVSEELERWRSTLWSERVRGRSDGIEEIEMEEVEVRERREVAAESGKRINIKSNDAIAPMVRERKYRRLEHSIMVQADIRSRYASTLVSSTVENTEAVAREVFFSVFLPETAFISRFAMEIEGIFYVAEVREKEEAWRKYKDAVEEGKTAGHVGVTARHSNRFRVSVNTSPHSIVTFYLLYEELLGRRGGVYEYTVNISPHQRLASFNLGVAITEQRNFTRLEVPGLRRQMEQGEGSEEEKLKGASIILSPTNPGQATITYSPEPSWLEQQLKEGNQPLQFILHYEVDRSREGGEVQLMDGYFVHFVAPENLPPMPKHVIFVLDTSGSMRNRKMQQTIEAMVKILGEMRQRDFITIIDFATNVTVWERVEGEAIIPASLENIEAATRHVEHLEAEGETNINGALLQALKIVSQTQEQKVLEGVQPMVLFLTDGHPTVGETDTLKILQNVKKANADTKTAVFSLAFGRKTDFSMLRLLSVQNFGFARKIYTAADASLQLEGFYQEVSSPILSNVTFDYLESSLVEDSLTETAFHTFYQGGEMVVAGMMDLSHGGEQPTIEYKVTAHQATGDYSLAGFGGTEVPPVLSETVDTYIDMLPMHSATKHLAGNTNFMERLWAYLTIKNLLTRVEQGQLMSCNPRIRDRREEKEEDDEEEGVRVPVICNNLERALFLSLRYQFVTPLTSLVVIKPDTIEKGDIAEADLFNRKIQLYSSGLNPTSSPLLQSAILLLLILILLP